MADLLPFPATLARTLAASVRDDVRLDPLPSLSIVSLRARGEACARAAEALGLAALPAANTTRATRHGDCLWVRPDEWWVVGEAASREATLGALQVAVAEGFGAAIDLSASRVALELSGARARD
ncbi:MAG TPA: sarcosine oxidase subunit gamma family protein, partial [Gemmatimonadaceae bacterium]|nr:sarcosine oxidase subunit gamma family protein [Gemmatimonadaceae bacterium]